MRRDPDWCGLFADEDYRDVHAYFADHPELSPTPLKNLRSIASELDVHLSRPASEVEPAAKRWRGASNKQAPAGSRRVAATACVLAKDETQRFGINAFKIVGVRYAVHRMGDAAAARGLVCATAGNHGRAVARVARQKQVPCTVFVPAPSARSRPPAGGFEAEDIEISTRESRINAMRADGATVVEGDGSYEDAVRAAAEFGEETGATIISDTSWDGYEQIPRWIMAGYTQILEEAASQWDHPPTVVIIQGGVGGLVCAAASWFAYRFGEERPYFIAAEPENAACLMMSAQAGHSVTVDGSLDTIMAGLRCAEPSPVAWPAIAAGVDAFVTVSDQAAIDAMRMMSSAPDDERIDAGPSGVCGLAALVTIARDPALSEVRTAARLDRSTRALVIITEGP